MANSQRSRRLDQAQALFEEEALKPEYEHIVDILSKIIESRVAGIDDVTDKKFTMLSALLNNYLVDWSRVVYHFLKSCVHRCVQNRTITKHVGFGFLVAELMKAKCVKL